MEWMDKVYLTKYDEKQNTVEKLLPFEGEKHFYKDELEQMENDLHETLINRLKTKSNNE